MERSNATHIDIENQYDPYLATLMGKELDHLSSISPSRCIYRVPKRLRKRNEDAYTPQVVSIGPLHHGKEHLKAMEGHKKRYLQHFLRRNEVSLDVYINKIREQEVRLRSCYAEDIGLSSDEFVKIILVDAAFIIEFLFRCFSSQRENDYIFDKPWMLFDVIPDMQLLENQLPFFILEDLFDPDKYTGRPSIIGMSYHVLSTGISIIDGIEGNFEEVCSPGLEVKHFVDFIRILSLSSLESKLGGEIETAITPSITELHQAGVKFKVGSNKNLFDIRFADGILEIPKLRIENDTEITISNLLAFEQCHYVMESSYISNYVVVMGRFVNTSKDVDLLVEYKIIENEIGDNNAVSTLMSNFERGVRVNYDNFYFATLIEDLNKHCETPWNNTAKLPGTNGRQI